MTASNQNDMEAWVKELCACRDRLKAKNNPPPASTSNSNVSHATSTPSSTSQSTPQASSNASSQARNSVSIIFQPKQKKNVLFL
jgi:hypothetical protein